MVHAGAGGVGLASIEYAHWVRADAHATTSRPHKRASLRHAGISRACSSRDARAFVLASGALSGTRLHAVLNSLSRDFVSSSLALLGAASQGELEAMLQDAYAAQEASLAVTLETLGQQSSALNAFSSGLTRISTKGLDEAEVEQAVQEWLQNVVNSAAASVTDPSQYARAGETTVDTLSRLATALNGINPILDIIILGPA